MRPPRRSRRTLRDEISEETAYGILYVRRLRHSQLVLSLLALVAFAGLVGSLPLLLSLAPGLRRVHVLGIPLDAILPGLPVFPLFVAIAVVYARRADALDRTFDELVRDE